MKTGIAIFALFAAACATAAPFATPGMMRRNGLTDEQYEALWAAGRHPRIEPGAAREWIFRASRYSNVTNWLDECGRTNDFAALSYRLQGENFALAGTNAVLAATNSALRVEVAGLEPDAKALRKAAKAAAKAAEKDAKNFEKWIGDTEKAARKSSAEMAEFYDAVLAIATNAASITTEAAE